MSLQANQKRLSSFRRFSSSRPGISYLDVPARAGREGALPLLLLHGVGSSSDTWSELLPLLDGRRVVAPDYRGRKLADLLYDDFEKFARERVIRHLTCEVNAEPPNPVSLRFHERRGFKEVGREEYAGKTVSMLHCPL